MKQDQLTQDRLKSMLHYEPETGVFRWLVNRTNGVKAGDVTGTTRIAGYAIITFLGKPRKAHRLAWLYMTGAMPPEYVDHINGIKDDNRWCNLRLATNSENQMNRGIAGASSGCKNVTYVPNRDKFQVSIRLDGVNKFIGYFDDLELADLVACAAREKFHGSFARHR